ncbi:MAG: hypothetical protein ACREJ2_15320, partial [Planctomycetota bacterium]
MSAADIPSSDPSDASSAPHAAPLWPPAVEAIVADRLARLYDPVRVRRALEDTVRHDHLCRWLAHGATAPRERKPVAPTAAAPALDAPAAAPFPAPASDLEHWIDLVALCPA